ncbi:murein biosynthesis integral membrane protein MurJ, partial [Patulibacter sp. S7RM1-6]
DRTRAAAPGDPDARGGAAEGVSPVDDAPTHGASGRARNTIIFSIATGLSRIAGLVREMFVSALYGGGAVGSAFSLAFLVPNLLRSLFADMALSAAFVPVFTELLEQKRRREAVLLLSTLFWVILGALSVLCAVAMLAAPLYMPLFVGDEVRAELQRLGADVGLVSGLSQVMLPTVLLLGLNGLLVGALNAYDHFTVPALSPLVWNVVIIVVNLALLPAFEGPHRIYAQAVGVLVGTVVQLLMAVPVLRRYGIRLVPHVDLKDPRVKQVFVLMVPVALSLGLINFSAAVDGKLAGSVSEEGPRAIEVAFRLYMLPQGVFSVAIVTVLFPVLSRAVARRDGTALRDLVRGGMAQILVLLVPVGLLFASPVISHDIITVLFQRGEWTDRHTDAATVALVWLGLSLALNGASLLLSRTFFALQRPWTNTALAVGSLVANVIASVAMYRPLGLAGIVLGTFVGNVVLVALQLRLLRKETGGPLGLAPVVRSLLQVLVASALAVLAATAVALIGRIGTDALGPGTASSIVTVAYLGLAIVAGGIVYVGLAHELGLAELEQAGGRFVRLGGRLGGMAGRVPGVPALVGA